MADTRFLSWGFPFGFFNPNDGISFNTTNLNASGAKIGYHWQAPEACTITKVGFRYGARTGTPPTYKMRLFPLNSAGVPDLTDATTPEPSVTFTPPADATWDSTWRTVTLDNTLTLAAGDFWGAVIAWQTGTINGSNFSSFASSNTGYGGGNTRCGYPVYSVYDGASWTKLEQWPLCTYYSASQAYGLPTLTSYTTAIGSSGNRAALKFSLSSESLTSFKLAGLRFHGAAPASGNWTIGLWNAAGTALQSLSIDGDFSMAADRALCAFNYYFSGTLATLTPGTTYYLGIQRGTQDCTLYGINVNSTEEMRAFNGGQDWCLSTWNGSAWSDTTTTRPNVEMIFADITATGGGTTTYVAPPVVKLVPSMRF